MLSDVHKFENGVRQETILSVTLFAVTINIIISELPDGLCSCLYVDDLFLSFSAAMMPLITRNVQ